MVGLATQLVRVMRGTNVQRYVGISQDMVTHVCWHLTGRLHGGWTHDEDYMRCCNGDCDIESTIMDQEDLWWRAYHGGAYLGMMSLVAMVIKPRHSGEESLQVLQGCLPCEEEFT